MKYTPGPWRYEAATETLRTDPSNHWLASFNSFDGAVKPHNQANANLIAAAPELYSLLSEINTAFYLRTSRKDWIKLMEKTKPLLQKARGEDK